MNILDFLLSAKRKRKFFDAVFHSIFVYFIFLWLIIPGRIDVASYERSIAFYDKAVFVSQRNGISVFKIDNGYVSFTCRGGMNFSDYCFSKKNGVYPLENKIVSLRWIVVPGSGHRKNLLLSAKVNGLNVMDYPDVERRYSGFGYGFWGLIFNGFLLIGFYLLGCFKYHKESFGENK